MRIYGSTISGNCLKVKWVCDHLAIPYEWVETSGIDGTTRKPPFLKINPMGQVPAIALDDGRTLAQSNAIIRYLARGSALIPSDAFEAAQMDAWLFWEQYSHEPYIAVCRADLLYRGKTVAMLDPARVQRGYAALALMEQQLTATRFLVGGRPSLADVALIAYTRVAHEGNFDLSAYPQLRSWIRNTEAALGIKP